MEIGRGNCNECDGEGTKVLIVTRNGIWSKCKRCGMMEWEWKMGDSMDYLKYLADRYNTTVQRLLEILENIQLGDAEWI